MYNDTITLFNRYESRLGDTWYPTVLTNVNLNIDKASIIAKFGAESQDNAILNIRYQINDGDIFVEDKQYLPPKEWDRQINDLLPSTITFTDGQQFDFFYVGDWGSTETVDDEAYLDGFYNYMNTQYDYVFQITSVAQYSVIPHFEIMGK